MKNPGADRMGKVSIHEMSQLHESVPHSEWMTAYSGIDLLPCARLHDRARNVQRCRLEEEMERSVAESRTDCRPREDVAEEMHSENHTRGGNAHRHEH